MILAGLHVLLVEDEPIIALGVEDLLLDMGATPLLAERLDEAHEILAGQAIGAAILDVNVHGGRSYGVAERLVALAVPFIFATGYGAAAHPDAFADVPTLTKPYGADEVRDAFAKLAPRPAAG